MLTMIIPLKQCDASVLACPGIRQHAPSSALIKPIGFCGTENTQNFGAVGGVGKLSVGSENVSVCFGYHRAKLVLALKSEHVVVFQDTLMDPYL